jgi:hypothetical protein
MTNDELDKATADEAWRILEEGQDVAVIAARLAREGYRPPKPVDPDLLAWREWMEAKVASPSAKESVLAGEWDNFSTAKAFVAGARYAREQGYTDGGPVTAIMTNRRLEGYMNGLRVAKLAAMALNQEYGYVRYQQFIDVIEGYEREVRGVLIREADQ